jgi:(2S)-methylsuccinyl-CoA dehydrogenase
VTVSHEDARRATESAASIVDLAVGRLADVGAEAQVVAHDVAHSAAGVAACRSMLDYGEKGEAEALLASALVADVVHELRGRMFGREDQWGATPDALADVLPFVAAGRHPDLLSRVAAVDDGGPRHLGEDFTLVAETFRRFADDRIAPVAEEIHRTNADVPEEVIDALAELGCFGLSIPETYGGFASGGTHDLVGMVVATEELSRGSLGIGGSLITRPEILTRALLAGGTEEQKRRWLHRIASGGAMVAVAVTEPDHGSDVARIRTTARPASAGGWLITGTKTWCTFAGRAEILMLLARTDPESNDHRGLSLFVIEKPARAGHAFHETQSEGPGPVGGQIQGRAIDTIGYRGMHSYEVNLDDWWVPDHALIGQRAGIGRGFYLQMEGFENGRLQTAARAVGVMQAAYEAASAYADDRVVFGRRLADFELTRAKLARMAVLIQSSRQFALAVARDLGRGADDLGAAMVKAYACRAAEWVTREAMQIHGGMGYAEEYDVSRYFVDARVLSIFEGTDETLCLKVIIRRLIGASN